LAALAKAEAIDPNYTEARETVAYIRRRQGKLAECYDVLNRVLLLNPRDSGMLIDMATTAAVLGRPEETFAFIERCRQLDPTLPDPYFMKAYHIWVLDGDLDTARAALDEMPDTEHPWAIWVRALQLLYEDNYRGVVEYLGKYPLKVVETHAESIPMSLLSGLAYRELDEATASRMALQTARGLLEDRVAQNPDDPRPYFSLGYTLALLGECDAALSMLRWGAELAPIDKDVWGNPFMYVWSMGAHASCGDMDEAFALLGRILGYPSPVNSPHLLRLVHQAIPMRDDPRFEEMLAR
jgi:tetratricopeptide (TPR) repeat protein